MRKRPTYLSVILAVAAALVAVAVLAGGGGSGTAAATATDLTPRAVLEKVCAADRDVTRATADFQVTITAALDPDATAPAQAAAVLAKPIEITGSAAVDGERFAGSVSVDLALGDGSYRTQVAMRWIGDQAWVKVMGVWYEAPPEMRARLSQARARDAGETIAADGHPDMMALKDAGLDPWSWVTGLRLVGTGQVRGVDAYHISGGLDMAALIGDVVAFTGTPQFEELLKEHAPAEALARFRDVDRADIEKGAAKANEAVRDVRGEVWVAADTCRVLRATGSATFVPPAEANVDWLDDVGVSATVTYGGLDQPVTVQPPADPRPWDDLKALLDDHGKPSFAD